MVELGFCPYVDASGGLIEDQDLRAGCQPFPEEGFLLVASGERLHRKEVVGGSNSRSRMATSDFCCSAIREMNPARLRFGNTAIERFWRIERGRCRPSSCRSSGR